MSKSPLQGLVIRTAVVLRPDLGFIYAADPKQEEKDIPHAIGFRWNAGAFQRGDLNYSAHTVCHIAAPVPGLVDASEPGYYSLNAASGKTSGDILEDSDPPPKKPRRGGIRSVSEIAGKAYAVGFRGLVYRLDKKDRWTRIDDGLPAGFDIEAAHGFSGTDVYAVGEAGAVWHFNGKKWTKREMPTNASLNAVRCAGDSIVYIGGADGLLIAGRDETWKVIDHDETDDDVWDLEWFDGKLYVSTLSGVYRLKKDKLEPVKFGDDSPKSFYQLSAAEGVLWSNGEHDIMSFDGKRWKRVV